MTVSSELRSVDLGGRGITEMPVSLLDYQDLEVRTEEKNKIQNIPEVFFINLVRIQWLDLRENKLIHLPSEISNLKELRCLLLDNNALTALPIDLGLCRKLTGLHVSHNPLTHPPPEIISQGCSVILKWLSGHLKQTPQASTTDVTSNEDANEIRREPSRYDLWNSPSKLRHIVNKNSRFSHPSAVNLRSRASISSAFLGSDYSIKLPRPHLPTERTLRAKAKEIQRQMLERSKRTTALKQIERMRKPEVDENWRRKARQDQFSSAMKMLTGELMVEPLRPPFGVSGDRIKRPLDKSSRVYPDRLSSTALNFGHRRPAEDYDEIRHQIGELMSKMSTFNLSADVGKGPLHAAEENLMTLQVLRRALHRPFPK